MKPIVLALTLLSVSAFAAPEDLLNAGLVHPDLIQKIKPKLELTDEQEASMNDIVQAARAKGEPVEALVKEQRQTLHQLLRRPDTTAEAADAVLTKLLSAEGEIKHLQLRTLIALRDVMTPEQQKKAMTLNIDKAAGDADILATVKSKANRLRDAVDAITDKPTEAMAYRGGEIEELIKSGQLEAANTALDQLIKESGIDEPELASAGPDFSTFEAGDTDTETLQSRFESVKLRAQDVISIPLMRKLLKARDALEEAKANQDATAAGRILTWAEKEFEKL